MEKSIEKIALEIGKTMIESGAEISRCEDTIIRILKAKKCSNINVFCINSLIIIKTENALEISRIKHNDLDLYMIEEMNSLSRSICSDLPCSTKIYKYSVVSKFILTFLATGSFCIYFGGSILDGIFAGLIGLIIDNIKIPISSIFARTLVYSIIGGTLSIIPYFFINTLNIDKIMIGTIMLLIPGLTIGNAIRDIMSSDILSGIIEITEATFTAISIALGYGITLGIFGVS